MWVRGLKLRALLLVMTLRAVAPYVGAWIETEHIGGVYAMATSHPMWVRGLKPSTSTTKTSVNPVAPYVGAWIETSKFHE